jgi:hypothetical protein
VAFDGIGTWCKARSIQEKLILPDLKRLIMCTTVHTLRGYLRLADARFILAGHWKDGRLPAIVSVAHGSFPGRNKVAQLRPVPRQLLWLASWRQLPPGCQPDPTGCCINGRCTPARIWEGTYAGMIWHVGAYRASASARSRCKVMVSNIGPLHLSFAACKRQVERACKTLCPCVRIK